MPVDISKLEADVAQARASKQALEQKLVAVNDEADDLMFTDDGSEECHAAQAALSELQTACEAAKTIWLAAVTALNQACSGEL